MQLISLDIRNFRVIKEAHLAFPDAVIGVIGPNGAGKSSIIEAIYWALYGNQVARSGKDEIKGAYASPADSAEVRLEFVLHQQTYTVTRRLVGKTERPEVELLRDGRSESVGSAETKGYVGQLLGLDWRGFLTSFLARQQELNALSDLQPAKRREHLAGMLGIERLDRAIQRLKDETKTAEERTETLERLLTGREQVAARVITLREHAVHLSEQVQTKRGLLALAEQAAVGLAGQVREHEEKRATCSRLRATIEGQNRTREHLVKQVESQREHVAAIERSQAEQVRLGPQVAQLPEAKARLEQLRKRHAQATLRAELVAQAARCQSELEQIGERLPSVQNERARLEQEQAGLPGDLDQQLSESRRALESARDDYGRLNGKREAIRGEVERVDGQVRSVGQIGPETVCDRCHRPYGTDLPRIQAHLESELRGLREQESELRECLETLKQSGKEQKHRVEELERGAKRRYEIEAGLKGLRPEEERLVARREEQTRLRERLARQLAEAGEAAFDPEELPKAERQVSSLEQVKQEYDRLTGFVTHRDQVERDLAAAQEQVRRQNEEIKKLEGELAAVGFDEAAYLEVAEKGAEALRKLEAERSAQVLASRDLELAGQELKDREEELVRVEGARRDLESSRDSVYYGVKLGRLLGDFRKLLIAQIRPRLAEISGQLMAEMTDGRYNLIDLDEEYNIRILDGGEFFGIDRFSGGEKDLANLCLRLAISLALTESAGLSRSFVILDEVFASQDDSRRELILRGLAGLRNRFPQILLITHIQEIKDRVEQLYEVMPTGLGWSEVTHNGA